MDSPQDLKISFVQDHCDIHGRDKRHRGASVEAGVGEVRLRPIDGPYGRYRLQRTPRYPEGIGGGNHPWSPWSSALYPLSAGKVGP